MPVPAKRRASSQKKRRASHFALKAKNLIPVKGSKIPHALKKAATSGKKIMTRGS